MVTASVLARCFVYSISIIGGLCSPRLTEEGEWKRSQLESRKPSQYLRIVQGLFQSDNIVRYISDIPADVIEILKNDEEEAKNFIENLEQGNVPAIIQDLGDEVIGTFKFLVGTFGKLPDQIIDAAEAVVNVFNDIGSGNIEAKLKELPEQIASDIRGAVDDFKNGVVDAWKCIFNDCPATTTANRDCSPPTTTAQTPSLPFNSSPSFPTAQPPLNYSSPTQTGPKPPPSPAWASQLSTSTFCSSASPARRIAGGLKIDRPILSLLIARFWVLGLGLLGAVFLL